MGARVGMVVAETYFNGTWVYADAPDNDLASWEERMHARGFVKYHEQIECCTAEDFEDIFAPMKSSELEQRFRSFQEGDTSWLRADLDERHVARLCASSLRIQELSLPCTKLRMRRSVQKKKRRNVSIAPNVSTEHGLV